MIELTIMTKLKFKSISDVAAFIDSREAASMTGFPNELKLAYATTGKLHVVTPNPPHGEVCESWIQFQDLDPSDEGN